jgi:Acetyltransferase (GNAT) domain
VNSLGDSRVVGVDLDVGPDEWLEFARSQHGFGAFHHPAWSRIMAECYGYRPFVVGARGVDGRLLAGIPMMRVRGALRGPRWVGLPFTDHLEPLPVDGDSVGGLLDGLFAASVKDGISTVAIRSLPTSGPVTAMTARHVLQLSRLSDDFGEIAARFKKGHVGGVRKAERSGITVRIAEDQAAMHVYYKLHVGTRRRQGVPAQPRRFFDLLWRYMIEPGMGFVMLAHKGPIPVAGAVFLWCADVLTYKYSASDASHLDCSPNNILLSHAIQWACEHGCRTFDWGRTDVENEGLRRFKAGWGAVDTPLGYSFMGREPKHDGPGVLEDLVSKTIKVAPEAVCRIVGEVLYRYAG